MGLNGMRKARLQSQDLAGTKHMGVTERLKGDPPFEHLHGDRSIGAVGGQNRAGPKSDQQHAQHRRPHQQLRATRAGLPALAGLEFRTGRGKITGRDFRLTLMVRFLIERRYHDPATILITR